jgi:hypothetical protein
MLISLDKIDPKLPYFCKHCKVCNILIELNDNNLCQECIDKYVGTKRTD